MAKVNFLLSDGSNRTHRTNQVLSEGEFCKQHEIAIIELQHKVSDLIAATDRIDAIVYGRPGSSGFFNTAEKVQNLAPKFEQYQDDLIVLQHDYRQLAEKVSELQEEKKNKAGINWQITIAIISVLGGGIFALVASVSQVYFAHKLEAHKASIQQVR